MATAVAIDLPVCLRGFIIRPNGTVPIVGSAWAPIDRSAGHVLANAFRHRPDDIAITLDDNDQKFLVSIAANRVIRPHRFDHAFGCGAQHAIAEPIAVSSVDLLKMVKIDQRHA